MRIKDLFKGIKELLNRKRKPPVPRFYDGEEGQDGLGPDAADNTSGIASFRYSYNGSIGGDSYHYRLCRKDGGWHFSYESMLLPDYGEMETPAEGSYAEKLWEAYLDGRIAEWEGFSKYNTMVLDGSGFSLEIVFNDGKHLYASGTNAFPRGYREFEDRIDEIFKPLSEKAQTEARDNIIRRGIQGSLSSALVYFKQRGDSGGDEYNFQIGRGGRGNNFSLSVKSVSGEFFPKGSLNINREVPDGLTGLEEIDALIRRYDLIEWYNYEGTDPDHNNKEWFQVSFCFDGMNLNAMGSAYPANYGAFRKDFLTLMASVAERVQKEIMAEQGHAAETAGKDIDAEEIDAN